MPLRRERPGHQRPPFGSDTAAHVPHRAILAQRPDLRPLRKGALEGSIPDPCRRPAVV